MCLLRIFAGILIIEIYAVYMGDEFLMGAAFSPLLIIALVFFNTRFGLTEG